MGLVADCEGVDALSVGWPTAGLLAAGTLVSVCGDQVASIGLVLVAAGRHSPVLVAVLFVVELLPGVVLGTWIGRRVDRLGVRQVWVAGLLAEAVSVAAAATAGGLWVKAGLIAVTGCFGVVAGSAGFRGLRELAGAGTGRLNALQGAGRSTGGVAGAALGGIGLAVLGLSGLLGLDAVSFVVFAVAVWAATGSLAGRRAAPPSGPGQRLRAAELRLLSAPAAFGGAGLVLVLAVAFATSLEGVVGVFYLRDVARLSTGAYGLVIACWSVGSAAAAVALARFSTAGRAQILVPAALVMGAAIGAVAAVSDPWVIGAVYLFGGAANGSFNVALANVVHDGVPAEHLGAAWAVLGALLNASVLVGYIAGAPGAGAARLVVALSGGICIAVAAAAAAARRATRHRRLLT